MGNAHGHERRVIRTARRDVRQRLPLQRQQFWTSNNLTIGVLEAVLLHVIDYEIIQLAWPIMVMLALRLAARIGVYSQLNVVEGEARSLGLNRAKRKTAMHTEVYGIESVLL